MASCLFTLGQRKKPPGIFCVAWIALTVIFLAGCATEGGKDKPPDLTKYKSVCFTQPAPFDQIYMARVAAVLNKFGFDVWPAKVGPDTLVCIMGTKEGSTFDYSFVISLWSNGKKVLMVEARDPSYGSHTTTKEASEELVKEALEKLEKELAKARNPPAAPSN